jgi:hypothetical protein
MSAAPEVQEPVAAVAPAGDNPSHHGGHSNASLEPKKTATLRMEAGATASADPPLPYEDAPPLPDEPPPDQVDDGWEAFLDEAKHAYYFYNHRTGVSQWENPRVPQATAYTHVAHNRFAIFLHFFCPSPA